MLRFGLNLTLSDVDDNRVHFIKSLRLTVYPGLFDGETIFGVTGQIK